MVLDQHRKWYWISLVLLFYSSLVHRAGGKPLVPCFFIFGDSLVDNGNNNLKFTNAKSNYWPFGIDFPAGPTGRFCNGRTSADIIAELLGFADYIPSYATVFGREILRGVNYASAGAGIRDETSQRFGDIDTFNKQLDNFKTTVTQVEDLLADEELAAKYLNKCIYSIGIGTNDLNDYSNSTKYTPSQFIDVLIQQYSQQLKTLYEYGARKIVIHGGGPAGCAPFALAQASPDGKTCLQSLNLFNQLFNRKLMQMVQDFNKNLIDANFIYINAYGITQDVYANLSAYGFRVANSACCGEGRNNAETSCPENITPCKNRTEYLFWDAFHPTEAANVIFRRKSISCSKVI